MQVLPQVCILSDNAASRFSVKSRVMHSKCISRCAERHLELADLIAT